MAEGVATVKIALNLRQGDDYNQEQDREKAIERDVGLAKKGDWEAKSRIVHTFMPLLMSLAKKRSHEAAFINRKIETGKDGLMTAIRRYKPAANMKFEVFALTYIENAMDRSDRPGFFARLFGRE